MIPAQAAEHTGTESTAYAPQEAFVPDAVEAPAEKQSINPRLIHAAGAAGVLIALLVALWLKPDPRGLGTHEQLMLFPCNFHALTGLPCPFCGMTTAFAHMVRGNVREAVLAQPMGAIGFVATIFVLPLALIGLVTGKDLLGKLMRFPWGRFSKVIVAMFAAAWAFKIIVILVDRSH